MSKLTRDQYDEFLAAYKFAHIGTVDGEGAPYTVPVAFYYTGSAMLVAARGRSQWYPNIVRDGRVSVCVDEVVGDFRRIMVSKVNAEILFEPGREQEWKDTKRMIEIKGMTEEAADAYLLNVSKIPYALVSIPFEYGTDNVMTWSMASITDTDQSGMMPKRYGEIVNTNVDAESWLENPNLKK